jgi:RimJ/RimL family protein N-acetyltransferase
LFLVSEKESGKPAGICGLLKRDYLEDPDIGFAFLPEYRGKGYAIESAAGIIKYGKNNFNMSKILAITQSNNIASIKLLSKLGFNYIKDIKPPDEENYIQLYGLYN